MEAEQRRQRRLDGRGGGVGDDDGDEAPAGGGRRSGGRWEQPMAADPVTGQNADGSFSRSRAFLPAGPRVCSPSQDEHAMHACSGLLLNSSKGALLKWTGSICRHEACINADTSAALHRCCCACT